MCGIAIDSTKCAWKRGSIAVSTFSTRRTIDLVRGGRIYGSNLPEDMTGQIAGMLTALAVAQSRDVSGNPSFPNDGKPREALAHPASIGVRREERWRTRSASDTSAQSATAR